MILKLEKEGTVVGEDRRTGESITLSDFNYFMFGGTEALQWSPAIYAKLAYEGKKKKKRKEEKTRKTYMRAHAHAHAHATTHDVARGICDHATYAAAGRGSCC